jgi:hypothetical protein
MHIIRRSERALGVAQGEVDVVTFPNELVEIFCFAGERLLQQAEEVLARRSLVIVSKFDMVPPSGGCVFYDQA